MFQKSWKYWSSLFFSPPFLISSSIIVFFTLLFLLQYVFYFTSLFSPFYFLLSPDKSIFSLLERVYFDKKLQAREDIPFSDKIVIIEIGEDSIKNLGRYPFNRRVYSDLLKKLEKSQAKVVSFDILFSEKDSSYYKATVKQDIYYKSGDKLFAKTLKEIKIPVVFGYFFENFGQSYLFNEKKFMSSKDKKSKEALSLSEMTYMPIITRSGINLEEAKRSSNIPFSLDPVLPHSVLFKPSHALGKYMHFGFFDSSPDADGVLRQSPLITFYKGNIYPSLAIRTIELFLQERAMVKISGGTFGQATLYFPENHISIPLDHGGKFWINYSKKVNSIQKYELVDVLDKSAGGSGVVGTKELAGKLIFVGVSAQGMMDRKSTPYSTSVSGVKIHANIANSILESRYLRSDFYYFWFGLLFLSLGAALYAFIVMRIRPTFSALLTIMMAFSLQYVDRKVFFANGIIMPIVMPSIQYGLIFIMGVLYRFLLVDREKRFTKKAFSSFVSPVVVDEILKGRKKLQLGGENKLISVFFADIEGFTKISEHTKAYMLFEFMNDFFTEISKIILKNKGTLDKYIGDAVMCFWGAPLEEKNHAFLACKVALEMEDKTKEFREIWERRLNFPIRIRIGISSGEMIVGNMGSTDIFNYTVIGDKVNLASRLESLNKTYGTEIIVNEDTFRASKDRFVFRKLDSVQVLGREKLEAIYELVAFKEEEEKWMEWIINFKKARLLYKQRKWKEASFAFKACLALNPKDKASLVFLDRLKESLSSRTGKYGT